MKYKKILIASLVIWTFHFIFMFYCSYFNLMHLWEWDARWYGKIIDRGYIAVTPPLRYGNVAFFPGYPLVTWLLKQVVPVGTEYALLITSQLCALLMWISCFLFLEEFGITGFRKQLKRVLIFAIFPFSFFFMVGYSESLFTFAMFSFLLFAERFYRKGLWKDFVLAAVFGILMSCTRMVGVFICAYPFVRAAFQLDFKKSLQGFLLSGMACMGTIGFFIYCQLKFGAWNLYMTTTMVGWGQKVDWKKLLYPVELFTFLPFKDPHQVGRFMTIVTLSYLFYLMIKAIKHKKLKTTQFALVTTFSILTVMTVVGRSSMGYLGMGRYLLPTLGGSLAFFTPFQAKNKAIRYFLWCLVPLSLFLFLMYAYGFANKEWIS